MVASAGLYTYADCSVVCGGPQFSGDHHDSLLNPLLIVEVPSPSTEGCDRGKKFELYRTIESLREYLIVHQDRRHVEHYSKQEDGSRLLREHSGMSLRTPRVEHTSESGGLFVGDWNECLELRKIHYSIKTLYGKYCERQGERRDLKGGARARAWRHLHKD
jgi:hypothetical protein